MTLLAPLGLLGLLGLIALIIIYIIKPNYQQKIVSSTYIWKLSLKYRKKTIPISKLRNILIILCQIFILTAAAMILAKPVQVLSHKAENREIIAIIDSSASMRAGDGETRFERAVDQVQTLSKQVLDEKGLVSVIIADKKPAFLAEKSSDYIQLNDDLNELVDNDDCSYGVSDIPNAFALCESLLDDNPDAEIFFYTDTKYSYVPNTEKLKIVDVTQEGEWNVSILDAYTVLEDNFYSLYVDVACYGRDRDVTLNVVINGANGESGETSGYEIDLSYTVRCSREQPTRVIFVNEELYQEVDSENQSVVYYPLTGTEKFFSYSDIYLYIQDNETDSFVSDNSFSIFGGAKETIKVLYRSKDPNPFFPAVMQNLRGIYRDKWDFWLTEVKPTDKVPENGFSGYDFYFFEHEMPEKLPTDGVVFLSNPDRAPKGADFVVGQPGYWGGKTVFMQAEVDKHPILNYLVPETLGVTVCTPIKFGPDYETLLTCNGIPTLSVCNTDDAKVVVMSFSVHYSNLAITENISILMYNIFEYFIPATVNGNAFEVDQNIQLNARGTELYVNRDGTSDEMLTFREFPATLNVSIPGSYIIQQSTFAGKDVTDKIYVRIPKQESNIWATVDALENPYKIVDDSNYYNDLLLYIAGAIVVVLFLEWWLQSRVSA
ncbi:MAG: VWA domain-containing protein [Clostridia bacterium]|nr:VWA domain-containing protein [Clostridia bacterium]